MKNKLQYLIIAFLVAAYLTGISYGITVLSIRQGGTATSSTPSNGQILIGNGVRYNVTIPTQSTGISITTASGTLTFLNTGVQTVTQGTAISVSSATGTPTITNTGLQTLTAGNGLSITSATGTPTISNTGVTSLIQNTGISLTSTTGNVGIINTGVQSAVAGVGITVSSATGTVTFTNSGVLSLTQNTGISLTSTTGNIGIINTGVQTLTGTANQITVSSATGTPTLSLPQNIHTAATPTFAGLTLSNFSNGGVVFASVGGLLTQSSTVFYWDNNNTRLGINTNSPSTTLHIVGTGRITGQVTLNDPTFNALLYTNGSNVLTGFASSSATGKVLMSTGTAPYFSWETSPAGGSGITSLNGLTTSTQTFSNDTNVTISSAGSVHTLGWTGVLAVARGGTNTSTAFTSGSIIFSNGTSLAQNNSGLFWDNTNLRLGLGTTSPATTIHSSGTVRVVATSTTALEVQDQTGGSIFSVDTVTPQVKLGSASATPVLTILGNKNTSGDPTCTNGALYYNSNANALRGCVNGIYGAFGHIIYNKTSVTEASNTANFVDLLAGQTIAANALGPNGMLRVHLAGDLLMGASNAPTLNTQISLSSTSASTTFYQTGTSFQTFSTSTTFRAWSSDFTIQALNSTSSQYMSGVIAVNDALAVTTGLGPFQNGAPTESVQDVFNSNGTKSVNMSISQYLTYSVKFSTAATNNRIRLWHAWVEVLNP